MRNFIKTYLDFKEIWREENLKRNSQSDNNDEIILKAFEIYFGGRK